MKNGITATAIALLGLFMGLSLTACSSDDAAPLVSSARAASPSEPLYPPLQADAADGYVHEYH